ncbi:MAG TPA: pyridoxal-phosphate dependent enzyme [Acidimicrobiia bacterium]|nr:pyridoxal-phosphate dependent enzyme [Acidimicrobiia bacterium]
MTPPLGEGLPRCRLATLPTPLLAAPALSEALGVEVWVKRDDMTGLALGGNKARKLEFLGGEAVARGADTLVTGGGSGSNHVQLTAAAAARLGLGCVVVCYGSAPTAGEPLGLRLTRRFGAEVLFTGSPDRASVDIRLDEVAAKLTAEGRRPYVIPRGGASAVGAVGYALAAVELADQLAAAGLPAATLLLATGSCGTQAGLVAGAALGEPAASTTTPATPAASTARLEVVGVPVSRPPEECVERIVRLATGCAERLGSDRVFTAGDVHLLGGYLGPGYGKASPEGEEAAVLAARTESLVLDPVFTAKAMAALVAEGRRGALAGPVVFLHTGGTPSALAALP